MRLFGALIVALLGLAAHHMSHDRGIFGADVLLVFGGDDLRKPSCLDVEDVARLLGAVDRHLGDHLLRRLLRIPVSLRGELLDAAALLLGALLLLPAVSLAVNVDVNRFNALDGGALAEALDLAEHLSREGGVLGVFGLEHHDLGRGSVLLGLGLVLRLCRVGVAVHDKLGLDRGGGLVADYAVALLLFPVFFLFLLLPVEVERIAVLEAGLLVRVAEDLGHLGLCAVPLRHSPHLLAVSLLMALVEDALYLKLAHQIVSFIRIGQFLHILPLDR